MNKETQIQRNKASQRRGSHRARLALLLFCAFLLVCGGIALMLFLQSAAQGDNGEPGWFQVKAVTASGSSRYTEQQLVQASQIVVGQSIFQVDEERAIANLLQKFPYLAGVSIDEPTYDTVHITVTETAELGVVGQGDHWMLVGQNGRALQTVPRTAQKPQRYLYLSGIELGSEVTVGQQALDEQRLQTALSLLQSCARNGVSDIGQIDLQSLTAVKMHWRSQVVVLLGSASNLEYQIRLLSTSLPQLLERYGQHVRATYDLRAFSDPTVSDPQGYFTPTE